jgi:hypothetical protein
MEQQASQPAGDKPKSGIGTSTPDEFGSYGESTIPKTSNMGKGGDTHEAGSPTTASTPPGVPPTQPGVTPAGVTPAKPGVAQPGVTPTAPQPATPAGQHPPGQVRPA